MNDSGDDRRVRRTKKAIREALLRLMQDKHVAQVTTTELCMEADVNRSTFYAHYSAPEDVLAEIEEEFLQELSDMFRETYEDGGVTLAMCKAIDRDRDRWRSIWHGDPNLIERAIDMCCEQALTEWRAENIGSEEKGALFLQFITRGASGVVGSWVDEGCRVPPEELSSLIEQFVFEGQRAVTK